MNAVLSKLRRLAAINKVPIIQSDSERVLLSLVRQLQPQKLLEVGTAIGYSALALSQVMPDTATLFTIERELPRVNLARRMIRAAEQSNRIQVAHGDALVLLTELTDNFDFVFLDAAKGQYLKCLELILPHLNPGAVVVADNVLFRGLVHSNAPLPRRQRTLVRRLEAYLAFVNADSRFNTTVLAVGDGIAISYYQTMTGDTND